MSAPGDAGCMHRRGGTRGHRAGGPGGVGGRRRGGRRAACRPLLQPGRDGAVRPPGRRPDRQRPRPPRSPSAGPSSNRAARGATAASWTCGSPRRCSRASGCTSSRCGTSPGGGGRNANRGSAGAARRRRRRGPPTAQPAGHHRSPVRRSAAADAERRAEVLARIAEGVTRFQGTRPPGADCGRTSTGSPSRRCSRTTWEWPRLPLAPVRTVRPGLWSVRDLADTDGGDARVRAAAGRRLFPSAAAGGGG